VVRHAIPPRPLIDRITEDNGALVAGALNALPRLLDALEASMKREAVLTEALEAALKFIEEFKADGVGQLAEGIHAGLRKGSDAPDSGALYNMIARSTSTAWSDAIRFAHDPFFSMWGGNDAIKFGRLALSPTQEGRS